MLVNNHLSILEAKYLLMHLLSLMLIFPNDDIFNGAYDDDDVGAEADFNNMDNTIDFKQEERFRRLLQYNKLWLVAQGFRQEEGIDYDEVFARVARIEAIRLFLAFASYMGFTVYQMDVKSAFLYGTIGEEVYVQQPLGFVDPAHPNKVYKVIKALYGLHQAPRAWYETLSSFLLENGFRRGTIDKTLFIKKNKSDIIFQMSSMGELTFFLGLQVKQQPEGIFISQDKYVADILKKFDFCSIKTATTPIESNKPLVKDEDGVDVDVHIYRSMIGSLMYLTASRPDIMFAVCACARFQVTPKASHLNAVKQIFRYLKHQPKLGLWYPRDSPFELEAFSDSDYGGASLDRKSTTGGCQFLGRRLISWQCKKQTIVANSTTKAEYVDCYTVLGYVQERNVYHSRTKHIEIRHHFIRDCYEKRLIDVVKIHTDNNVADLLTKGFDVTRFNFLVESYPGVIILYWFRPKSEFPGRPNINTVVDRWQDTEIPQSQGPTFTHVADEATTTGVRVVTKGATTTTSGLDAGLDSGNIHESPLRSHEAPPNEGHTSGSAKDSLQLKELMVLVPKLVTMIANLEKELHQIKTTYGKAVLTLVERVKSLEVALKRKTKKVVVSDLEDEETEN
ncbi:putative ribonuclease H-like domain-containing protein [Tanacetum coccineum]